MATDNCKGPNWKKLEAQPPGFKRSNARAEGSSVPAAAAPAEAAPAEAAPAEAVLVVAAVLVLPEVHGAAAAAAHVVRKPLDGLFPK